MDRRSHGVYGYGIEKSTSQMQLSSRDDDERVEVKDVMAGSVARTHGRLWIDTTKESDAEIYAEYSRSSSAASVNREGDDMREPTKMGLRGRRDSVVGQAS